MKKWRYSRQFPVVSGARVFHVRQITANIPNRNVMKKEGHRLLPTPMCLHLSSLEWCPLWDKMWTWGPCTPQGALKPSVPHIFSNHPLLRVNAFWAFYNRRSHAQQNMYNVLISCLCWPLSEIRTKSGRGGSKSP